MHAIETETRPTTAAAHHEERFAQIPLHRLVESAHNPRTHFDPVKLAELAASIAQKGIVEPQAWDRLAFNLERMQDGRWPPLALAASVAVGSSLARRSSRASTHSLVSQEIAPC